MITFSAACALFSRVFAFVALVALLWAVALDTSTAPLDARSWVSLS